LLTEYVKMESHFKLGEPFYNRSHYFTYQVSVKEIVVIDCIDEIIRLKCVNGLEENHFLGIPRALLRLLPLISF